MPSNLWSPEVREKIAKLIRLLSTSEDGEALATTRAIQRTLASQGSDMHELADMLLGNKPQELSSEPPRSDGGRDPSLDELARRVWTESCHVCLRHTDELSEDELVFVLEFGQGIFENLPPAETHYVRLMELRSRIERRAR